MGASSDRKSHGQRGRSSSKHSSRNPFPRGTINHVPPLEPLAPPGLGVVPGLEPPPRQTSTENPQPSSSSAAASDALESGFGALQISQQIDLQTGHATPVRHWVPFHWNSDPGAPDLLLRDNAPQAQVAPRHAPTMWPGQPYSTGNDVCWNASTVGSRGSQQEQGGGGGGGEIPWGAEYNLPQGLGEPWYTSQTTAYTYGGAGAQGHRVGPAAQGHWVEPAAQGHWVGPAAQGHWVGPAAQAGGRWCSCSAWEEGFCQCPGGAGCRCGRGVV